MPSFTKQEKKHIAAPIYRTLSNYREKANFL